MSDVAVVAFAQAPCLRANASTTTNGVEMLVPIFRQVMADTGLSKEDIGFWCSGSSDYLAGRAFSFVAAVDAIGAFPPVMESHVEMDAAWALYEAWVKILTGQADTALVYGFGKSSAGDLGRVLALQLDPYTSAPLWPDHVSIAALQARLGIEAGRWSEQEMAEVAVRSRAAAKANPEAQVSGDENPGDLLKAPYIRDPLREHDCAPVGDGAAAVILASAGRAGVDVAELHAPFTHQEILLRSALGLGEQTSVNPSGGALCGNPMFAAGLARIGMAAREIFAGRAGRALGHATSGPALQQNLICVMEGRDKP